MSFPFQLPGTQNNGRNPTLLPNLNRPYAKNGVIGEPSSYELAKLMGSGTPASGTVTVAGTMAAGNVITLTIANGVLKPSVVLTYTATSTDTTETIAEELASLVDKNEILSMFGFWATTLTDVLTIYQRGVVGNFTTLAATSTGAETFTITNPTGGAGPIVPLSNFGWANNGNYKDYWYGQPFDISYDIVKSMVSQGMPIA